MPDEVRPSTPFDNHSLTELVHALKDAKDKLDAAKKVSTAFQKEYDLLSISILPERFDAEDVKGMVVDGVGRLSLRGDMKVNVPKDAKARLLKWFEENELSDLISEAVNAQTLKAWVKEQISKGSEIPDDIISIHVYTRAVITKA